MTYNQKLQSRIDFTGSRLCVGLDPRPSSSDDAKSLLSELQKIVEQALPYAAIFKPNMAYFEALGLRGIEVLDKLLKWMPSEAIVVLDAKRSDIGETQKYYAQSYFEHWNVDAVTLNPFLGYDSIEPFLGYEGRGVYLLAVTSNIGSADFQQKKVEGKYVFELVQELGLRAQREGRLTDVGLVVGLTNTHDYVLDKIGDLPLLVPGLGAQGGRIESLARSRRSAPNVINVSRGISVHEPELTYAQKAQKWAAKITEAYNLE